MHTQTHVWAQEHTMKQDVLVKMAKAKQYLRLSVTRQDAACRVAARHARQRICSQQLQDGGKGGMAANADAQVSIQITDCI